MVVVTEQEEEQRRVKLISRVETISDMLQAARTALLCNQYQDSRLLCDGGLDMIRDLKKELDQHKESNGEGKESGSEASHLPSTISMKLQQSVNTIYASLLTFCGTLILTTMDSELVGSISTEQKTKLCDEALAKFKSAWGLCRQSADDDEQVGLDQNEGPHVEFEAIQGIGSIMLRTGAPVMAESSFLGALASAQARNDLQACSSASALVATAILAQDPVRKEKAVEYIEKCRKFAKSLVDQEDGNLSNEADEDGTPIQPSRNHKQMLASAKKHLTNSLFDCASMYEKMGMMEEAKGCLIEAKSYAVTDSVLAEIDVKLGEISVASS